MAGGFSDMIAIVSSNTGFEGGAVLDTGIASVARVYDYMLGGKDNFAVDRQLGDELIAAFSIGPWIARQNRAFLGRAVTYCAERGMTQFLDIGSGLPPMGKVHPVDPRGGGFPRRRGTVACDKMRDRERTRLESRDTRKFSY